MKPTKWYEESPGVVSSKRLFGAGALGLGIAMKLVIFVWALFAPIGDSATAGATSDAAMLAGASLLGITALDVFKRP